MRPTVPTLARGRPTLPGERLRAIRKALGIKTRNVEVHSRNIAQNQNNPEYYISHSFLTQVEKASATPGIYRLFSLSVIYRINYTDLLFLFGIDLDEISKSQLAIKLPRTHLIDHRIYDAERPVSFPIKFDPGATIEETSLISRMVETWGELPIGFVQHLSPRKYMYGFIGIEDHALYPMIRPGSLVQIDDLDTKIDVSPWQNEFERPIYFLQLRTGYACGWCELAGQALSLIPHPLSGMPLRQFDYPNDVDVLGRVTGVAMSFRKSLRRSHPALGAG